MTGIASKNGLSKKSSLIISGAMIALLLSNILWLCAFLQFPPSLEYEGERESTRVGVLRLNEECRFLVDPGASDYRRTGSFDFNFGSLIESHQVLAFSRANEFYHAKQPLFQKIRIAALGYSDSDRQGVREEFKYWEEHDEALHYSNALLDACGENVR